ncbi:MAG: ribosomal-protein-alanine N-acetyltransferase [Desulfurococcales archaeon ex4484_217_1]|nr:MAG: ribosomal-protein-alanine N-acetyltransferase [Desulfurococcales archaeon ex4484_217_1]
MALKIRPAREDDIDRIFEVETLSFKEPYPKGLLYIYLKLTPELFLVIEKNGKVIGYTIGLLKPSKLGHIVSLAIDPKERRKGYGTLLLKKLLEKFKELGVCKVRLEVRVSNRPAINLYSKHGFKIAYIIKRFYLNGEDAYVMVKDLNEG